MVRHLAWLKPSGCRRWIELVPPDPRGLVQELANFLGIDLAHR